MKLKTTTNLTLDGVMQGLGGAEEDPRNGFERGGWAIPLVDAGGMQYLDEVYGSADAFPFGRHTYEIFARSWGAFQDPGTSAIAAALNARPKYLVSNTLKDPRWAATTAPTGDLATAIRDLKARNQGTLLVPGSGQLVRWLLGQDLVDQLDVVIYPIVVGQGTHDAWRHPCTTGAASRRPGRIADPPDPCAHSPPLAEGPLTAFISGAKLSVYEHGKTHMRADALRNQRRLLDAAVDVILEVGGEPSLDSIARRAGVGIGTLYRRYPDREALLQATAVHVLEHAIASAEVALAQAPNGYAALRQYMHSAFDQGVGVLNLIYPLLEAPSWPTQRNRITPLLKEMVGRCKGEGSVRGDLEVADIAIPVIRFSRSLATGLSSRKERALARRHLDIYINGLAMPLPQRPRQHLRESKGKGHPA